MSDDQLNKSVLTTTTNTKQFTRAIVNMYCYGQPDLVNYPVMRQRIRSIFRNIHVQPDRDDTIQHVRRDVQTILMVVRNEYLGERDNRNLRYDAQEMDLELESVIEEFLVRKGVVEPRQDDEGVTRLVKALALDDTPAHKAPPPPKKVITKKPAAKKKQVWWTLECCI